MSQNPFEAPVYQGAGSGFAGQNAKAPSALMVILIFALIIGILGTIGACFGAGGLAFGKFVMSTLETANARNPSPEIEAQLKVQQIAQDNFVLNLALVVGSLVLAPMMATGAIACLNRKAWGHLLLSIAFLGGIVFVLIRLIMNSLMQLKMKDVMADQFKEMAQQQGNNGPPMDSIMGAAFGVGIAFGVIWALIQIGFYLWGFLYLKKEPVKAYLNVK